MQKFKDQFGREWNLSVNMLSVKQVKEQAGILLTSMFDDQAQMIADLGRDFIKLYEVLWVLCEKQAESMKWTCDGAETIGVKSDQFAEGLCGDAMGESMEALVRATADFFTSPEQRRTLQKTIDMMIQTGKATAKMAEELVDRQKPELLARNFIDFAMSGPELPVSTPADSPLANCR